jgi:uncharacterized protein (TIGR02453 family)
MATSTRYFTPGLFDFLGELSRNNNRDWFLHNKARYESEVRDPFLRFLADLQPRMKKLYPRIVVDPKPVGGSMMRIYRDIRFSKDKTPYKTSVAAHLWHGDGNGAQPGFYLHLAPGQSAIGGGVWRPPPNALQQIRSAIAKQSDAWRKVATGRALRSGCGMVGESLKRPPPGFAPDHPFIEDIKRKDFATSAPLADRAVCGPDFMDRFLDGVRATAPFVQFVSKAMGLKM